MKFFFYLNSFKRCDNFKRCDKVGKGFREKQILIKNQRRKKELNFTEWATE